MDIITALQAQQLVLPQVAKPAANYLPVLLHEGLVFISGQLPFQPNGTLITGSVGKDLTIAAGYEAAKLSCLQVLAQLQSCLIHQNHKLVRCLKLTGFINASNDFKNHPQVMNGASDLLVDCFGVKGQHSRAAIGCSSLPLGAAVEIEALFAVRQCLSPPS